MSEQPTMRWLKFEPGSRPAYLTCVVCLSPFSVNPRGMVGTCCSHECRARLRYDQQAQRRRDAMLQENQSNRRPT